MNDEMEGDDRKPIGEGIISSRNSQVTVSTVPTRVDRTVDSKKTHNKVGIMTNSYSSEDPNESVHTADFNSNSVEENDSEELLEKSHDESHRSSTTTPIDANSPTQLTKPNVGGNDQVLLDHPPTKALANGSSQESKPSAANAIGSGVKSDSPNLDGSIIATTQTSNSDPKEKQTTGFSGPHSLPPPNATVKPALSGTSANDKPLQIPASVPPTSIPNVGISVAAQTKEEARLPAVSFQLTAQQAAEDEAIAAARAPLINLYGAYLCHSKDSSLADARRRLRTAISQTRDLRQTFTERVYGKYRVCLQPPPLADDIIAKIEADPVGQLRKLKEEIANIREEKEIEKKEAAKLNSEMSQSSAADRVPVLTNIDNAEQLMFLTAGLNLVLLPEEQTDSELLREYTDRFHTSGQRMRNSISQAAATAGEVILDRTRKAAAMRVERQRRRQLQLLRGEVAADGESESNYSRLQVLAIAGTSRSNPMLAVDRGGKSHPPNSTGGNKSASSSTKRATAIPSKSGRARNIASLPTNTLLSLNPIAEEVKTDGKISAATAALIARGVGLTAGKTTQQRLKHPHPESLGGRRRANMNPSGLLKKDDETGVSSNAPEPFLQAYLANTLPPLPASKERLERKRISEETVDVSVARTARGTIKQVLSYFTRTSDDSLALSVSKISLLNGVRKQFLDGNEWKPSEDIGGSTNNASKECVVPSTSNTDPVGAATSINPALTMSVLHALGIIGRSHQQGNDSVYTPPLLNLENKALCSDKLTTLHGKINSSIETKLTQLISESPRCGEPSRKRTRNTHTATVSEIQSSQKTARLERDKNSEEKDFEKTEQSQEEKVWGETDTIATANEISEIATKLPETSNLNQPKKRKRSASSPTRLSSTIGHKVSRQDQSQVASMGGAHMNLLGNSSVGTEPYDPSAAMNVFNLANQLRHMHHPAAGDLAEYLGSLQMQQQGYDLPSLVSGAFSPQISALGFMQPTAGFAGYTLQDRAATARAMLLREQQAAAILGGYSMQPPAVFPQVVPHQYLLTQSVPVMVSQGDIPVHSYKSDDCNPAEAQEDKEKLQQKDQNIKRNEIPSESRIVEDVKEKESTEKNDPSADGNTPTTSSDTGSAPRSGGMQFIPPAAPERFSTRHVDLIQSGRFHFVAAELDQSDFGDAIDYLLSLSASVPLPKGLILGPIKERLSTPGFKSAGSNSAPSISRDVVAAVICVWLWASHEQTFQQAFERNGRIDVDPECKWLVQAAVDTSVSELSLEIAESMARGEGPFAEAAALRKASTIATETALSRNQLSTAALKVDICTASIVSNALTAEMCVNDDMNSVIPNSAILVDFLDEARLGALRGKSQERVLLATLISRATLMPESFGHAYVSAMVRAGEALKHGRLFELVQDEEVTACTMLPYDIFTDETGSWEDPCKPDDGFIEGLNGDELMHRAHARAIIQKSLRKLQDRHHVRGGTPIFGPFVDSGESSNASTGAKDRPSTVPQRQGLKRRASSLIENPVVPGTGSAAAKSWSVYHPRHFSSPLEWDPDDPENLPYGLHPRNDRIGSARRNDQLKEATSSRLISGPTTQMASSVVSRSLRRSTFEIDWADIAGTFQSVELPRKSSRQKVTEHITPVTVDGTIFAPFFGEIEEDLSSDDAESDTEEDLTEATILSMHQIVLDKMKAKLEAYLEARKKQQELRKNKYAK